MSDSPDEMPVNPDENTVSTEPGLHVEDIPRVDKQLVDAIALADKPKDYKDVLAEQEVARKHRNRVIRTVGVAAATGAVLVTVAILKGRSAHEDSK